MKLRIWGLFVIAAFVCCLLGSAQGIAQIAYITNAGSNSVSAINTATDSVIATIPVGYQPYGVAAAPDCDKVDGDKVYVANLSSTVSVINTMTNKVTDTIILGVGMLPHGVGVSRDGCKVYVASEFSRNESGTGAVSVIDVMTRRKVTIRVGPHPYGVAVSPDCSRVYVTNSGGDTLSVIDTAAKRVVATIRVGNSPSGVAVSPDGSKVYVANAGSNTVSVIDVVTRRKVTIRVGNSPFGVAVSPDGSRIYVTNAISDSVSVINAIMKRVIATIPIGNTPFGTFGVAVTPDGSKLYIARYDIGEVAVVYTAKNTLKTTIHVGHNPVAFGIFISTPVCNSHLPRGSSARGCRCMRPAFPAK